LKNCLLIQKKKVEEMFKIDDGNPKSENTNSTSSTQMLFRLSSSEKVQHAMQKKEISLKLARQIPQNSGPVIFSKLIEFFFQLSRKMEFLFAFS
jgi:hypothetical protein